MKLKRLIVQGFKSFKDRTTIHFDDGITGIVGPNGCGKSNIVDALFWVMGEQSAKHLRGNTMRDVIFSGSTKYSPSGFAEATLVLGNDTGKHIHIGNKVSSPSEIQLTRKLYRNGETEYRINNEPCRLKDIQEVFMDTGAGAKSYSIIAQGEINRLVQAKPEERRVMIEEVAGITKFKLRKRDSLKKIEQTQLNLNRLQDLQIEIDKNLKALEKQAEKAERARTLKEKIRRHDLTVHSHKIFDLLKDIREARLSIAEKEQELEEWTNTKATLEVSLQEERIKKDDLTEEIEGFQKEYNELSRKLAGAEERLNSLARSLTEKEKLIETKQKDVLESRDEMSNRSVRLEELEASLAELSAQGAMDENLSDMQDQVAMLRDALEEEESEVVALKKQNEEFGLELNKKDQSLFQNNSKQEEYSRLLQDLTQEIEINEKQFSGVNSELKGERDLVHQLEAETLALETQETTLREKTKSTQETRKTLEQKHKELTRKNVQIESKLNSLKELNSSLEGSEAGVSQLIEAFGEERLAVFGTLIRSQEGTAGGVQKLLEDVLTSVVSLGGDQADYLNWISSQDELSLALLCDVNQADAISDESVERLKIAFGHSLVPLSEVVELDPRLSAFAPLMSGLYLVDELSPQIIATAKGLNFRAVFTKDGQAGIRQDKATRTLNLSGANNEFGLIARNNTIKELTQELETSRVELEKCEGELNLVLAEIQELETEYEALRADLLNKKSHHAAKKSGLESKLSNLETGSQRLEILKKRKTEISSSRLTLLETEETLLKSKEDLSQKIEEVSAELEDKLESYELKKDQYTALKEELLEKQVHAQSFEQRKETFKSQIQDVQGQIDRQLQRIESGEALIAQYEQEIEAMTAELEQVESDNQDLATILETRECHLNDFKDTLGQLLIQMQEREDQVKSLTTQINKNDKEITSAQAKIELMRGEEEQIVRNLFEKYQVDLRDCLGRYLEFQADDYETLHDLSTMYFQETENGPEEIAKQVYEFSRKYGQDLKDSDFKLKQYRSEFSRLGDINWQAIEEYDRQKLRADFLRVQESELKSSLENLQTAIDHIDIKSKERFKIAFEEVNSRFEKVFPIIFGGGSAALKVTADINDPECGIDIIAQPPGKNMQSINLMSGGEKAMTAVSLIFSIFLVKPSPFCLLDEVDAPLDDANVGRFNELLREMSRESQFILITHNKKTMELNDTLYGVTMQEPGVSKAVSVQLH